MREAEIELEILTSMFSHGKDIPMFSNGKDISKAEFRITELKSLLRTTLRELYEFKNLEQMKEVESGLFGNQEHRSPVSFRMKPIIDQTQSTAHMLPHKEGRTEPKSFNCLKAGKIVCFTLRAKQIDIYIDLLMQAAIVGSLGSRSRKGFGSFRIRKIKMKPPEDKSELLTGEYKNYEEILNKAPEGFFEKSLIKNCRLRKIESVLEELPRTENTINKKYLRLQFEDGKTDKKMDFPYVKKLKIVKLEKSIKYNDLLKKISQLTHKRLLVDDKIEKTVLGNFVNNPRKREIPRFASPIYITFWENGNNKFLIIKELNYNYIVNKIKKNVDYHKKETEQYVNEHVEKLIELGGTE